MPDRTVISHTYAAHSAKQLPTSITVQPGNAQLPPRTLGTQQFDGLERLTRINVGGRIEQLHYEGGRLQISRRVTPAGKHIDVEYKPGLTYRPTAIKPPEGDATFDYDPLNGELATSSNARGTLSFTYSQAGHLDSETWKEPTTAQPWVTRYTSSLKGRLMLRTDIGNEVTEAEYHKTNGRIIAMRQGQLQAAFEYDACGRLYRTTSTDMGNGNTLTTTLAFDDIGREIERTLELNDAQGQPVQPVRSIELSYLTDGNVKSRHLRVDNRTALLENYEYDLRGRLEVYACSGDQLPKDRFGNAIVKQYFEFDAFDNITYSRTDFDDGSQNITHFSFADEDPCKLIKAVHSHFDYQELATDFTYDPDGNLMHDTQGQQLHYDSLGRLMGVSTAAGQPITSYDYDAHDILVATKNEDQPETLRFYSGDRLSDTIHNGQHTQLLHLDSQPLGQQSPGDGSQTLLLLSDAKHSVIAESQADQLRSAMYTAYGEFSSDAPFKSLLAFNGEVRDAVGGWYLLGQGYRAYDPSLMRFFNPDPSSPFGAGGINCYKYCSGNPIAFSDPSGRTQQNDLITNPWFGIGVSVATAIFGIIVSLITFNPGPAAAAFKLSTASAVGTLIVNTAGIAAATVGATTSAPVFVGAAAAFTSGVASAYSLTTTIGTTFASFGVEGASAFVQDEHANRWLTLVALAVGAIALPGLKTFKPPKFYKAPIKSSSGSDRYFEEHFRTMMDYEADVMSGTDKVTTVLDVPDFSNARKVRALRYKLFEAAATEGADPIPTQGVEYSGPQTTTRKKGPTITTSKATIEESPPERRQEFMRGRQSNHKKNRTFRVLEELI
ncbi:RHS repeat-associated core domain-containing protein [Pseudomonas sp. REP124]|uniref:RHS repeat-associated core domain-containing protein n=1 Tax=Pseudomonas sp. REP124 TaxID=2875731 RepID=UPI001CC97B41|nr:RHS repeat-associated core domain-containing protein [Pseudomonas sp. REP124]MBZ9783822.1 RHS repeat-associated core domain-containing protein [Pseudomonas sp. REP124]